MSTKVCDQLTLVFELLSHQRRKTGLIRLKARHFGFSIGISFAIGKDDRIL